MRRGQHMTNEQKERLSITKSNPTLETRAKLSAAWKGHVVSPETGKKISAALMGHVPWNKGCKASPEARANQSAAQWKGGPSVWRRKQKAKRRLFGFNPLNSWFPGCEGHHINPDDVIHIPVELHKSVRHSIWSGRNMDKINVLAGQYLTEYWT